MKLCCKCKTEKSLFEFYRSRNRKDGMHPECISCQKNYLKEYIQTESGRQLLRDRLRKFYKTEKGRKLRLEKNRRHSDKWPMKEKARQALNRAVQSGLLARPTHCSECGKERKIEAHHYLGYSKERWLDIVWLCSPCHRVADKLNEKE